ncbi:MAG: hypothetical protein WKF78_10815 [Candidatus Limnocylindrales bacterium]
MLALIVLAAVSGPLLLARFDPIELHLDHRLEGPTSTFTLGTDEVGRDIFSRLLSGLQPAPPRRARGGPRGSDLGDLDRRLIRVFRWQVRIVRQPDHGSPCSLGRRSFSRSRSCCSSAPVG